MENKIDIFLKNFSVKYNIAYQIIKQSLARMDEVNTYILNDYHDQISVTLVDKMYNFSDTNIYFDHVKSSVNDANMYQIHFNAKSFDESRLYNILFEIFINKNIDYLKTLMKPLFVQN